MPSCRHCKLKVGLVSPIQTTMLQPTACESLQQPMTMATLCTPCLTNPNNHVAAHSMCILATVYTSPHPKCHHVYNMNTLRRFSTSVDRVSYLRGTSPSGLWGLAPDFQAHSDIHSSCTYTRCLAAVTPLHITQNIGSLWSVFIDC